MLEVRNKKIHIRMQVGGRQFRKSTGLPNTPENRKKAMAIAFKKREELELEARFGIRQLTVMSFTEGATRFSSWLEVERLAPRTLRSYMAEVKRFTAFFADRAVGSVVAGDIEEFKVWRTKQGGSPSSVKLTLVVLSKFFRFAKSCGWCPSNPCHEVKFPSDRGYCRDRVVTREEEQLYFSTALALGLVHIHDHCRLMLLTGARPDELRLLKKDRVDLEKRTMTITNSKTPAGNRTLDLVGEAVEILRRRMVGDSEWVFASRRKSGVPWNVATVYSQHQRVCESTGLDFVPYAFRHTFATRLAEIGIDMPTLAALLGHSGLEYVMRYIHITAGHKKSAMKSYERWTEAIPATPQKIPA